MPIVLGGGHRPPDYAAGDMERLFVMWKTLIAAQNYPCGVDHYVIGSQRTVCQRFFPLPSKLLFLGCGGGSEVFDVLALGHDVWGVTLNPNNIRHAREVLDLEHVYMIDGHLLPFDWEASFDGVLGFQYFEHTPSPLMQLMEVERVLKPGGLCYFETPGPGETMKDGFTLGANPHHYTAPTKVQVEGWMMKMGFVDVVVEEIGPINSARHLAFRGRRA